MNNVGKGMNLRFLLPTCWRHGVGIVTEIGRILKEYNCVHPLIVTDEVLVSLGVVEPVFRSLNAAGIAYTTRDSVGKEPTAAMFDEISSSVDLTSFDSVVAVGGGSVIDVSKGLAILGTFGGKITDYDGFDKFPAKPDMRIFAIPTTAGTGSEVSDGVVVIDEKRNTKFVVISDNIRPAVALTDPEMTRSMPPKVTACTGIDALIHAIEAYLSTKANIATDLFALKAIELVAEGLVPAYKDGNNIEFREKMQLGATMAMIAASNTFVGMCHSMDGPICALYHIPHGQACGLVAPAVLKFNAGAVKDRVLNIFQTMGYINPGANNDIALSEGYDRLNGLLDEVGLLIKLSDIGYEESHLDNIVRETLKSAQLGTNPRQPAEKDVEEVLRQII
jgi:alcohol dehydrogenase class IV